MYGWRARIGMLLPSVNPCAELEFARLAPEGVQFCTTRVSLGRGRLEDLRRLADDAVDAARLLADVQPDLILLNTTAGSFAGGPGYDETVARRIEAATGIPAATAAGAVLAALRTLGAKRIVLVTPYPAELNAAERVFLEGSGLSVVNLRGLELPDGPAFAAVEPAAWYRIVREAAHPTADAVLLSCTGVRAFEVINRLEADLGLPVVTSNQAALWYCLRRLGLPDDVSGCGRLLRDERTLCTPQAVLS